MPDRFIYSGRTAVAGATVSLKSTPEDFVLQFQDDLAIILNQFKTHLGLSTVLNRVVGKDIKGATAMIRFDSLAANVESRTVNYTFQIVLLRAGNIMAQREIPGAFTVEYIFERVVRLLQANGNFDRLAGISRLAGIEGGVSPPGANFVVSGKNLEEAVLAVTYTRDEPQLFLNNR